MKTFSCILPIFLEKKKKILFNGDNLHEIFSNGYNLHEITMAIFWKKKKNLKMSSAEFFYQA